MNFRLVRFAVVGVIATLTHTLIAILSVEYFKLSALYGNWCGFGVAVFVSYFGHYFWTFGSAVNHRQAVLKFSITSLLGFVLNGLIVTFVVNILNLYYVIGVIASALIVPPITFFVSKFWIFKDHNKQADNHGMS